MPTAFLTDPNTEAITPLDFVLAGAPVGGSWELPCLCCPEADGCASEGCWE